MPPQRVFDAIHPDDRIHFRETTAPARRHGGSVILDVPTVPAPGVVRRVVVRGRCEADPGGRMVRGTGVLIDHTDVEGNGCDAAATPAVDPVEAALERLADHAISIHRTVDDLDDPGLSQIRLLAKMLLLEIGHRMTVLSPRTPGPA